LNGCKPEGKKRPSKPYYITPAPFLETCPSFDVQTKKCPTGKVENTEDLFYRTLQCPTHHNKMMSNMQEQWDQEWKELCKAHPEATFRSWVKNCKSGASEKRKKHSVNWRNRRKGRTNNSIKRLATGKTSPLPRPGKR
jgi:hypothetical protein